jgi:hypothetical protein
MAFRLLLEDCLREHRVSVVFRGFGDFAAAALPRAYRDGGLIGPVIELLVPTSDRQQYDLPAHPRKLETQ